MAASQKHHESNLVAQTCRMPKDVYTGVSASVAERKTSGERKLSISDWLIEAAREKLERQTSPGLGQRNPVENSAPKISKNSVLERDGLRNPDLPVPEVRESAKPIRESVINVPRKHGMSQALQVPGAMPEWNTDVSPKPSAAELAARLGIKTAATIEEVEPGCDPESGYIPPTFVAVPDPVSEEDAMRSEFITEFGRQVFDRAMRIPQFKKLKWPERFEMAREQKERE